MQLITPPQRFGTAPTQVFGLTAGGVPPRYARGGNVQKHGLASAAEQLRKKGRNGDTILAHINPQEAGILKLLGGKGTPNPRTGLPEFGLGSLGGFVSDVFGGVSDAVSGVGDFLSDAAGDVWDFTQGLANDVAEALGPLGTIAAAYFGGPIGAAIYSGYAAPGDDFNFKNAALAGATSYGLGSLGGAGTDSGYMGYGEGFDVLGEAPVSAAASVPESYGAGFDVLSAEPPPIGVPASYGEGFDTLGEGVTSAPSPQPTSYTPAEKIPTVDVTGEPIVAGTATSAPIFDSSVPFDPAAYSAISTGQGLTDLGSAGLEALKNINLKDLKNIAQLGSAGMTAFGAYNAYKEQKAFKEEAARARAAAEKKKAEDKAFAEQVLRDYPLDYRRYAAGDISKYGMAKGGIASLPPRFLSGGGDGMSDSIKANIEGQQEARLADGEFVVPADVVSHIGNGSSKAGAKKLYEMMDRVRHARTGKEKQAPQINAKRLLPA